MTRFHDFDAEQDERDAEPLTVRLFDEDWTLPSSVPAAAVLTIAACHDELADGDGQIDPSTLNLTPTMVQQVARDLFPADVLRSWLDRGISIDKLANVMKWCLEQWRVGEAVADELADDADPLDPTTAATSTKPSPTSSNGGDSSKPTSPESTQLATSAHGYGA